MRKIFRKDQILTIPNLLSLIRLLLIPIILWLYCKKQKYYAAAGVIVLSGITDIVDGRIAHKFNMVSDFGKILDPIADKLTQIATIFCLTTHFHWMWYIIGLFIAKEIILASLGFAVIKTRGEVNSAKWFGKVNTVILYIVMAALIFFPKTPETVADIMIVISGISMCITLVLYCVFYIRLLCEYAKTKTVQTTKTSESVSGETVSLQ